MMHDCENISFLGQKNRFDDRCRSDQSRSKNYCYQVIFSSYITKHFFSAMQPKKEIALLTQNVQYFRKQLAVSQFLYTIPWKGKYSLLFLPGYIFCNLLWWGGGRMTDRENKWVQGKKMRKREGNGKNKTKERRNPLKKVLLLDEKLIFQRGGGDNIINFHVCTEFLNRIKVSISHHTDTPDW